MSIGDKVLGDKIKSFRNKRGWNQGGLAYKVGITQSHISKIENGEIRIAEELIQKFATAFEIQPDILVRNTSYAHLFGLTPLLTFESPEQGFPIIAYFASALTGLNEKQEAEIKELDEAVDEVCRNYQNYSVALYRPRTKTSPKDNPDIPARNVYEIDQERVATSDLLILAAVHPSLGAGMELQLGLQSCSSIILLKKKGQKLSRMVLGCPAIIEFVEYEDLNDLKVKVIKAMNNLLPSIAEFRLANPQLQDTSAESELGKRICQLREQRNFDRERLARLVGVDVAYIESLETKSERIVNPSLQILRRIAKVLWTSEAYLITGQQGVNSTLAKHFDSLKTYAEKIDMSVSDFNKLCHDHTEKFNHDLSLVGVSNRLEIDEKYWEKMHKELKEPETNGRLF